MHGIHLEYYVHREKNCFIKYGDMFIIVRNSFNLMSMHYTSKHFYRVAVGRFTQWLNNDALAYEGYWNLAKWRIFNDKAFFFPTA